MAEYVPSPCEWASGQVELYEGSGGTRGTEPLDTGLPVIIVTHMSLVSLPIGLPGRG